MFHLVLIFVSGFQLHFDLPEVVNDQKTCLAVGVAEARHINSNVTDDDKVLIVRCLLNA